MQLKNKARKKIEKCKKKALENYKGHYGIKVTWSEKSMQMFGNMFELFFEEISKEFYIRADGRKPESDLEVDNVGE